jgi:hypothetical protein
MGWRSRPAGLAAPHADGWGSTIVRPMAVVKRRAACHGVGACGKNGWCSDTTSQTVSLPDHRRPAMSDHVLFPWYHCQADIILWPGVGMCAMPRATATWENACGNAAYGSITPWCFAGPNAMRQIWSDGASCFCGRPTIRHASMKRTSRSNSSGTSSADQPPAPQRPWRAPGKHVVRHGGQGGSRGGHAVPHPALYRLQARHGDGQPEWVDLAQRCELFRIPTLNRCAACN